MRFKYFPETPYIFIIEFRDDCDTYSRFGTYLNIIVLNYICFLINPNFGGIAGLFAHIVIVLYT